MYEVVAKTVNIIDGQEVPQYQMKVLPNSSILANFINLPYKTVEIYSYNAVLTKSIPKRLIRQC